MKRFCGTRTLAGLSEIRHTLSPMSSRLVAPEMPSLPCSSEARSYVAGSSQTSGGPDLNASSVSRRNFCRPTISFRDEHVVDAAIDQRLGLADLLAARADRRPSAVVDK